MIKDTASALVRVELDRLDNLRQPISHLTRNMLELLIFDRCHGFQPNNSVLVHR